MGEVIFSDRFRPSPAGNAPSAEERLFALLDQLKVARTELRDAFRKADGDELLLAARRIAAAGAVANQARFEIEQRDE